MKYYLTSNPISLSKTIINEDNGFLEAIKKDINERSKILYVCSHPSAYEISDLYADELKRALDASGVKYAQFTVFDERNIEDKASLIKEANVIVLAGGHVPTQNDFFKDIDLKASLQGFKGIVIGVSAGSMNSASTVYAQPEQDGEAMSVDFERFREGLGITNTMIIPHYQLIRNEMVDGKRVFEDIAYTDSMGKVFYALDDGTYILGENGVETIMGRAYAIKNGKLSLVSDLGRAYRIQ